MSTQPPISPRIMFDRLNLAKVCDEAMADVNPKIAPAELTGWDFDRQDDAIIEFHAKWGLVRFSVFVELWSIFHGIYGQEKANVVNQIMRVAPRAMADAIGRIARDAAQEHLSILNGRVERVEGRVTELEGAANDRDEAESEERRGQNRSRWQRAADMLVPRFLWGRR